MATIYDPAPGLGASVGAGLSGVLNELALQKARQVQQQQARIGLEGLGYSPEQAEKFSQFATSSPASLQELVKQAVRAPQEQAYAQALGLLAGGQPMAPQMGGMLGQLAPQAQEAQPGMQPSSGLTSFQQGPLTPRLTAQQATKLAELNLRRQDMMRKDVREAFKLTAPERREILKKAQTARQDLRDLARLEELEDEGKLDTPGYVEFLKKVGLDLPTLMSEGSQEFQKITQNFMRNAKAYLGARISNFELEQFLKTIPSLSQSPEGRKRVISNLKQISRAAVAHSQALKEVIRENSGIPPLDLEERIDDKIEKKLDAISKQFKKDLKRKVPPAQHRLVTALQTTAGAAAGLPGKILSGVGNLLTKVL